MPIVKLIKFFRRHMKATLVFCYAVLVLLVLIDGLAVDKSHAHTGAEKIMGFWALFGFGACVLIVVFSKWYGHLGIMADEGYYERKKEAVKESITTGEDS
jgi:hypothetical protein